MDRAPREPRSPGLLPKASLGPIAFVLALAASPLQAAEPAVATSSWPWLALGLSSALAGAAAATWVAWRHRRLGAELRDARERARYIDEMLDLWQWQTDARHQLTLLRPPQSAGAAVDGLPAGAATTVLWELFDKAGTAALREQVERHASLQDIEVDAPSATQHTPGARARLRGRARSDEDGNFAGYIGTLRPLVDAAPAMPPLAADPPSAAESDHESFSYTVSHDLRAPIRVVEGFTRILKEDYGRTLDRIGNDHLDRVLGAAARMNSMIDSLLTLSKLSSQPLARQPVNLSQLAGYVVEDLRRQSPEREVAVHIEPGLQALGDPTLLRLVLENLLGNAWKYTGKRRTAEVWLERLAQQGDTFTVRDNGAGFDMRFADRLFGVFQRLHSTSEFQGTGVGLASVRRIVRRHGGEVWAEGEVERGASFHFSLPQTQGQARPGERAVPLRSGH